MKEKKLKWNTWVGKNYPKLNNRILILGQNPYTWPEDKDNKKINSPEFAKHLVQEHGLYFNTSWGGIKNSKFFRPIERLFFNKKNVDKKEIENFWNSVAFNQFVQRYTSNAKEKLKGKEYKEGWENLYIILENIEAKPKLIVLMGNSAFNHLPKNEAFKVTDIKWFKKIGHSYPKKGTFKTKDFSIPVISVQHPSHHFSWSKWHKFIKPYISDFIEELHSIN